MHQRKSKKNVCSTGVIWYFEPHGKLTPGSIYNGKFFQNQQQKKQLPPPMPRLFMGNTCNFSHHKQRRIYQFIITWNTRNIPVNLRSLTILNYMKQIEGRGRLTFVISLFASDFTLIYLYLPWKNKCKCNGIMHANVMVMRANVMYCFEQCKW